MQPTTVKHSWMAKHTQCSAVCVCVCVCARALARASVRAYVRVCVVRVCVYMRVRVCA